MCIMKQPLNRKRGVKKQKTSKLLFFYQSVIEHAVVLALWCELSKKFHIYNKLNKVEYKRMIVATCGLTMTAVKFFAYKNFPRNVIFIKHLGDMPR